MTRRRIFLETMEAVLKNSNKIILDDKQGVVPYLPLTELNRVQPGQAQGATR